MKNKLLIVSLVCALIIVFGFSVEPFELNKQVAAVGGVGSGEKTRRPSARADVAGNLMIRSDGEVQLSGVQVSSLNGGEIVGVSTIGEEEFTFIIETDNQTKVHSGEVSLTVDSLAPGDMLMVVGSFQSLGPNLTILAGDIRVFGRRFVSADDADRIKRALPPLPAKKMPAEPSLLSKVKEVLGIGEESSTSTVSATSTPEVPPDDSATTTPEITPEPEATSTEATSTADVLPDPATTTPDVEIEAEPEAEATSTPESEPEPAPVEVIESPDSISTSTES